jgi:hypothetical protein
LTTTYEAQLLSKFFAEIEAEIETNTKRVVEVISPDYAHYTSRCGFIKGMQRTLALWNEVQEAAKSNGEQKPAEQPRQIIDYEG